MFLQPRLANPIPWRHAGSRGLLVCLNPAAIVSSASHPNARSRRTHRCQSDSAQLRWAHPDPHRRKERRAREPPREALTAKYLTIRNDAGYTPLHHAAIGGHLDQVPAEVLTTENLSIRSNAGYSVFHTAAAHGNLGQIPPDLMTAEVFQSANDTGNTILHEAAEHGTLDRVPPGYLTAENVARRNLSGETVLHVAAFNGHLDQVPAELLTRRGAAGRRPPPGTPYSMRRPFPGTWSRSRGTSSSSRTFRSRARPASRRPTPPPRPASSTRSLAAQLTAQLLVTRNDNGDTPLHAAAFEGHLDQVPAELLTAERVGTRNYDGVSVASARHGARLHLADPGGLAAQGIRRCFPATAQD